MKTQKLRISGTQISLFETFEIQMFPVWDFVVWKLASKAKINMGWLFSTLSCQYLHNKDK